MPPSKQRKVKAMDKRNALEIFDAEFIQVSIRDVIAFAVVILFSVAAVVLMNHMEAAHALTEVV